MICDADVHFCPKNLFDDLKPIYPDFVDFYNNLCWGYDFDSVWTKYYNVFKDPSWPECHTKDSFKDLPLHCRLEIKANLDKGGDNLFKISKDATRVIIEAAGNYAPDLNAHLDAFDVLKIDRQLLTVYAPHMLMFYQSEKQFAVDMMYTWNNKVHQITQAYPNKFDAVGWLALQDLEASLKELERIIDLGFFAVQIHDHVPMSFIPEMWKIFEICEKNNFPIYTHPTRYNPYPLPWKTSDTNPDYIKLRNKFSYPLSSHIINFVGMTLPGNVLEKYPNLKIIVAERGIKMFSELGSMLADTDIPDPMPFFQKNFYFTVEPEHSRFLEHASNIGWDRLLFGSDYPHQDPGGMNRFNDVDLINQFLSKNQITQHQFDQLTHTNYLSLAR